MYGGLYRRGGHFIYSMGDYVLGGGGIFTQPIISLMKIYCSSTGTVIAKVYSCPYQRVAWVISLFLQVPLELFLSIASFQVL